MANGRPAGSGGAGGRELNMETTIKPGDVCLAVLPGRIRAIRVARVWVTMAGTVRIEVAAGCGLRPGATFDRRQCVSLAALENLSPAPAENPPSLLLAGVGAG